MMAGLPLCQQTTRGEKEKTSMFKAEEENVFPLKTNYFIDLSSHLTTAVLGVFLKVNVHSKQGGGLILVNLGQCNGSVTAVSPFAAV